MILDLRKLKRNGKDKSDFFFLYSPQQQLIELPDAKIVLPIKINGTISLIGEHSAYLEGEVNYSIQGSCTRCLEDATNEYVLEFAEEVEENNPDGY